MKDSFNPMNMSPEELAKYTVRPADEVRKANLARLEAERNKKKLENRMYEVDEIQQAILEEEADNKPLQAIPESPTKDKPLSSKRMRITFELAGGSYTVPAIDVMLCKYGVMVLLPAGVNDTSFSPSPGTELSVNWGNNSMKCFSPGTVFELPNFNCLAIVLIRAEG